MRLLLSMSEGHPASGTDHDPEVTAFMSTPLELEPGATTAQPESVTQGEKHIEGRSLGQIAWSRLKQWEFSPSSNVQWEIISAGNGYYRIVNRTNGMVVDRPEQL